MNAILETKGLTVRFGGLTAVDNVDLTIARNGIHGLIGPNGAGKTTLFNTISGLVPAASGSVTMGGADITACSAPRRAALGIRRTFQTVQLVQSFTVYENMLIGLHPMGRDALRRFIVGNHATADAGVRSQKRIAAVLDYLGIADLAQRLAGQLTIAQQRYVEIGRALVSQPSLLMLDEPTAGLSPAQVERLDTLIAKLPQDWDTSILLVEHVIPLVVKLCATITVLDRGAVIAVGTGSEIENNPVVQQAYLGERFDA